MATLRPDIGLGTPRGKMASKGRRQPSESLYSMFEDAQVRQFKEAFAMMDQNADGLIDEADLRDMLATLGKPATQAQLDRLLEDAPRQNGRTGINFTQFLTSMADHLLELDPEADMREAFECFDDGDRGVIDGQELRKWLGTLGDRMSDDEMDAFLSGPFVDKRGNFKYEEFLRVLRIADQEEQERGKA